MPARWLFSAAVRLTAGLVDDAGGPLDLILTAVLPDIAGLVFGNQAVPGR